VQDNITKHITLTYVNLRVGIAIIAFSLPVVLMLWSLFSAEMLLPSISAYYHTPMRDVFVGSLVAVGACLYLYKGFSDRENKALNCAGIFAVAVAFLPTCIPDVDTMNNEMCDQGLRCVVKWLHRISAFLFFVPVAYVSTFRGSDTVELIDDEKIRKKYLNLYRVIGPMMIVLPALAAIFFLATDNESIIFFVETAAIWAFALFWLTKVRELKHHSVLPELQMLETPR